ncbi:MAG: flavin reductase [Bacteroidota bacterium]
MQQFEEIRPTDITDNVFKMLDKDWMLVTAGTMEDYNTMTASWGHMGIMWNLPVAIAWVRPQRHTFGFINRFEDYTLSFFTDSHRTALQYCGTHSGRDFDKAAETGLTPLATGKGNVFFDEARLVLECRKIYVDDLKKKNFLLPEIARKNYPKNDFHRFFMGEITRVLAKAE